MILLLLTISTSAIASLLPPPTTPPNLTNKCTFTLWHRQQSSIDYIQLNTIVDHANNLTIDVASHRPAASFNSYTRIDQGHGFAVAGLLDDARLSITRGEGGGLGFGVGEVRWGVSVGEGGGEGEGVERADAWCDGWGWEGSLERRVRRLDCGFPCEKAVGEDGGGGEYEGVGGDAGQVRIGSV